jgi:hypothetical protein
VAFFIWLISFMRKSVRWRDGEYFIRDGMLVPRDLDRAEIKATPEGAD